MVHCDSHIANRQSPMPVARLALLFAVFLATAGLQDAAPDEPPPFNQWRQELIAEARARGYSEDLIQQALARVEPLPQVIQNDRSQAEGVVGFDRYYSTRVTPPVVRQGRELAQQHSAVLASIEAAYEVHRRVIVAIWGIETRYGRVTGNTPVFRALATLAWEPRRAAFFRGELFDALTMVARGDIDTATMTGSWAGAMGQAQFMPSSYLKFAEDFDGDGRRDIWGSTPDALASIANYLKAWGWDNEFRWGREVRVTPAARARIEQETSKPSEGCSAVRSMTERIPLTEWQRLGVRQANGAALPESDVPAALVDTDASSFLVYPNYDTILRYNCAHYYALTVARLSDQIR
jgi:membrane-bound lytic murein transglycosylase B